MRRPLATSTARAISARAIRTWVSVTPYRTRSSLRDTEMPTASPARTSGRDWSTTVDRQPSRSEEVEWSVQSGEPTDLHQHVTLVVTEWRVRVQDDDRLVFL